MTDVVVSVGWIGGKVWKNRRLAGRLSPWSKLGGTRDCPGRVAEEWKEKAKIMLQKR